MGRWGHRLFEGDHDIDIACDLGETLKGKPFRLSRMVHQTDMLAPQEALTFDQTDEYKPILEQDVAEVCAQLDSGLGDFFFEKVLAQAKQNAFDGPYRIIIAGALMMRAGAKIKPNHIQYLRGLVPMIHCNYRYRRLILGLLLRGAPATVGPGIVHRSTTPVGDSVGGYNARMRTRATHVILTPSPGMDQ